MVCLFLPPVSPVLGFIILAIPVGIVLALIGALWNFATPRSGAPTARPSPAHQLFLVLLIVPLAALIVVALGFKYAGSLMHT